MKKYSFIKLYQRRSRVIVYFRDRDSVKKAVQKAKETKTLIDDAGRILDATLLDLEKCLEVVRKGWNVVWL